MLEFTVWWAGKYLCTYI